MISGILSLLTIIFSILIALNSDWLDGLLFCVGLFVSTGAGAVVRRTIRGNLNSPIPIYAITICIIALGFWLGRHGSITIKITDPYIIRGEWWDVIAGTFAGALLPEPEEQPTKNTA